MGNEFVLLDLFNYPDLNQIYNSILQRNPTFKNDYSLMPIEIVNRNAQALLTSAGFASSGTNSELVDKNLDILKIEFLNQQVQMSDFYIAPYTPRSASIFQAAYFSSENQHLKISRVIWSRMNSINKLALMIHENLRFYQQQYRLFFSDKVLQNLTVAILVCPSADTQKLKDSVQESQDDLRAAHELQLLTQSCMSESSK